MKAYQKELTQLLLSCNALSFGQFTLKSGRKSPYFINTGRFDSGASLAKLGSAYAKHMVECGLGGVDYLFGAAYKGIPLATATAQALYRDHEKDVAVVFDRKEVKDHGDAGKLFGRPLQDNKSVVIIDDLVTAGTTMREVIPLLQGTAKVDIKGVVVLVDRCERGLSELSAVQETEKNFGIKVHPLLNVYEILEYLSSAEAGPHRLSEELASAMNSYLKEYAPRS